METEVLPVVGEDRHERPRVARAVVGRVELRDHGRREVVGPFVAEHAGLEAAEAAVREPVPPEATGDGQEVEVVSGDCMVEAVVCSPFGQVRDVEGPPVETDEEPAPPDCRERGRKRAPLVGGVANQVLLDLDPAAAEAGDAEEDHRPREEPERLEVEVDVIGLVVELGREKDVGVGAAPAVGAEPRNAGRVAAIEGLERPAGRGSEPPVPDEVVERTVAAPGQARLEGRADPVDQAEVAVQEPEGRLRARPGTRRRFGRGDDPGLTERPVPPLPRNGLLHGDAVVLGRGGLREGSGHGRARPRRRGDRRSSPGRCCRSRRRCTHGSGRSSP